METKRKFVRKGETIGEVALGAPDGAWTLDGAELPKTSVEYLLTFSLQALQDAYSSAADADEARAKFDKKRKRLATGTIGARSAGVDSFAKLCRSLARKDLRAAMEAEERDYSEFTSKPVAAQNDILDNYVNANRKEIEARAKAELASIDKAAERVDFAALGL